MVHLVLFGVARGVEGDLDEVPLGECLPFTLGHASGVQHGPEAGVVRVDVDHPDLFQHHLLASRTADPELMASVVVRQPPVSLERRHDAVPGEVHSDEGPGLRELPPRAAVRELLVGDLEWRFKGSDERPVHLLKLRLGDAHEQARESSLEQLRLVEWLRDEPVRLTLAGDGLGLGGEFERHGRRLTRSPQLDAAPTRRHVPAVTSLPPLPTTYMVRDLQIFPNVVLAPMEGVTDLTFRRLVREIGGAGLTCTEFIASAWLSADGNKRARDLAAFDPDERPVSLQIYGKDPAVMADAARRIQDMGATICDINMGCPSKKVCKNSGGSALMRDPALAVRIVRAVRAAIEIPLTVKMRSGFDADSRNAPELCEMFEQEGAEALTIHWRTREDLYSGQRAVDKITDAVSRVSIPVIANGDVTDPQSAERMLRETGAAGVMVGRGAMRNPWSLLQIAQHLNGEPLTHPTADERHRVLVRFLLAQRPRFRTETAALGRFKKVANHFCRGVPHGELLLRRVVLRSQSIDEAVGHADRYFALLAAYEAGDLAAFDAALAAA